MLPSSTTPSFRSYLTSTEKNSLTYSSRDACVDFFFHIVPDTPSHTVIHRLQQAWEEDPLIALKLVFHLRDIRGKGKSDKKGFYTCTSWLHQHHPKTLLANLHLIPRCGCYKDLLEVLVREIENPKAKRRTVIELHPKGLAARLAKEAGVRQDRDVRIAASLKRDKVMKEVAAVVRRQKHEDMALRLLVKLKKKPHFAELHDAIANIFAKQLLADKKAFRLGKFSDITFAAKFCPSLKSSYDLRTALCHAIAIRLFSEDDTRPSACTVKEDLQSKRFFDMAHVAKWCSFLSRLVTGLYHAIATRLFRVDEEKKHALAMADKLRIDLSACLFGTDDEKRCVLAMTDKLRKDFYVPLRQVLGIPEIYMSAKRWHELPYERVPSVSMTEYAHLFLKHDKVRYMKFLADVGSGKKTVAAGALLPCDILLRALQIGNEGLLAEAQWQRMVSDLKKTGSKLSNSMAVCDVSGSMRGTPMEVCIALGLLVAELSDEPFKNHLCTFSHKPGLHLVQGETVAERYTFTKRMDWGMNTNFQAVFRLLLAKAEAENLPKDKMVKRLFVFSDMEFDQASANPWQTDYVMITKMYKEAGYGNPPHIVFWNLRNGISTPVLSTEEGVVLVSGFSKNVLKLFLDEDAELVYEEKEKKKVNPKEAMMKALTDEYLEDLKVVD